MKVKAKNSAVVLAAALTTIAGQAQAASAAFDFDTGEPRVLGSERRTLAQVTATCPEAGYLVAAANAQFGTSDIPANDLDPTVAIFGISTSSINSLFSDPNFRERHIGVYAPYDEIELRWAEIGSTQRVDQCAAGQSITYRFLARGAASHPGKSRFCTPPSSYRASPSKRQQSTLESRMARVGLTRPS